MSAFQGATLGEFSWDPRGPAPFSSTNYKEGRDSSPSLLGLPGPIDIPAPGFGINREKWSPASSHSGITEREDHSSYEEKRVNRSPVTFQDKPILKESVGEGSSFFNMAPMHQELQPLEPLPAASPTGYGAAMSTSDDFAQYGLYGKNHSLELNPSMMGSRSADVPLSGFMAPDVRAGAGATTAVSKDYDRSYNISAPDYEMSSNNSSGKFGMNDYRVAPNVPNLNVPTNSTVDRSIMNMDSEVIR